MSGEGVSLDLSEDYRDIREAVGKICDEYPGEYWRSLEDQGPEGSYPTAFVKALRDVHLLRAACTRQTATSRTAGATSPSFNAAAA